MEDRVRLTLMGLSYTPMQDGAFALLLAPEDSNKRIPVIIGAAEAQAIAIVLENINPRRPMTHDLFATLAHGFGIELKEVFIYSFEDGIFASEMTFSDGERQLTLDSRTSDAVAVALRTGAPIYTTRAIVEETGVELVEAEAEDDVDDNESDEMDMNVDTQQAQDDGTDESNYFDMDREALQEALDQAIANDDFEDAAIIQRILQERFPDAK
ncbi:MAG: bifunctional nuclease family protein [Muribaculaceae bacterium]|nr:bifunctional nuclease family protein [Muribaculaceae bacterium]